jgi:hypothetical protein
MAKGFADTASALEHVRELLDANRLRDAYQLAEHQGGSPELRNATGVCLLRMGEYERALHVFRGLVLDTNGIMVRPGTPALFIANCATALLLTGNTAGCLAMLREAGASDVPSVRRLRAALERWRGSLNIWQRLLLACGLPPSRPVELGHPPGDLE